MVEEAERTNSPNSCSLVTASLEVIPSSLASSCTRTLATFLLSRSAPSQARTVYFLLRAQAAITAAGPIAERNKVVIVTHSSLGTHRVSIRFLTRFQVWTVSCGGRGLHRWHAGHETAFDGGGLGSALKGPSESAPLDRQCQALLVGVQPRTPSGHPASFIHYDNGRTAALGDQPDKLGPGAMLPASDTGANRTSHLVMATSRQFSHDVSQAAHAPLRTDTGRKPGSIYSSPPPRTAETGGLPDRRDGIAPPFLVGLRRCRVGDDVDPPTSQLRCEPGILALLADGQRELVVRNHNAGRAGGLVRNGDRSHPRRRQ